MDIRVNPDDNSSILICLSQDEAVKVFVDHGESFLGIPVDDSLEAILNMNAALASSKDDTKG